MMIRSPLLTMARAAATGLLVLVLTPAALRAQSADDLVAQGRSARAAGRLEEAATLFRRAVAADPSRPAPALLLAETLAWQKRFDEAEAVYRDAIERFGASRDARLGLGRVLLWDGRYRDARIVLSSILVDDANDVDAREELARSWYWSGDFRAAAREFRRVVALDPRREDARRALDEIRLASSPLYAIRAFHRSDDQPYQVGRAAVDLTLFSDPLTRWNVTAGAWRLDEPAGEGAFLGVETEIPLPALRLTIAPALRLLSFPDGEDELLGGLRVSRKISGSASLSIAASRTELLLNREAADDHPYVTDLLAQFDFSTDEGVLARARVGASRFHDGNDGVFADAYVLAPVRRTPRLTVSAGMAAAYRDTDEGRFRFEGVSAAPSAPGSYSYRWEGVYDPYWTPLALRELRAIASVGSGTAAKTFWNVQLSGGSAHDRGISFGPPAGVDPRPPTPFETEYARSYRPWSGTAALEFPIAGAARLRFDYEHTRSVYYEADEFRAALVGRF